MTEDEAHDWIDIRFGAVALTRMTRLAELVRAGSAIQNLVARSTLDTMWTRHIVDSAQLINLVTADATTAGGPWLDIGSGAGFPGLVVAALIDTPVILVEPRRRRAEFLQHAIDEIGLAETVSVRPDRIEKIDVIAAVISARAVAELATLFTIAGQCARRDTIWILPKGKSAREEVATAQQTWHGAFHVERSITDPVSLIVRASGVTRR